MHPPSPFLSTEPSGSSTANTCLHVLIPPTKRSRDLLTTLAALRAGRDPRLCITTNAPSDWQSTPESIRREFVDANTVVREFRPLDDPVSELKLAEEDVLFLVQAGAIPPRGWIESLLAHGRLIPGARAIAATSHSIEEYSAEGLVRWSADHEYAKRNWYRLSEDRANVDTPMLALFEPNQSREELREWWRSGGADSLRLPTPGRLIQAKDIRVLCPASPTEGRTAPPNFNVCIRDKLIEPDVFTADLGENRAQRQKLLRVLEDGPHPEASLYLARLCLATGERSEAGSHARACLDSWPNCTAAQLLLARALIGDNRIDAALAILESLQQSGPLDRSLQGELFACLGSVWLRKGEPLQARPCIEEALLLEPSNLVALYGRARLHLALGSFEEALEDLLTTTRAAPLAPSAWFELGRTQILIGDYQAGRNALLHLLDLDPGHDSARALLERTDPDIRPHLHSDLPDIDNGPEDWES
jgi:tetratricopeptide (TPR) repeat protein